MKRFGFKKAISLILCGVLAAGLMPGSVVNAAGSSVLGLEAVIELSLANSSDYQDAKAKVSAKSKEYNSAVKAVRLTESDNSTFRWSPIMNLALPENENLTEAYSYVYKPYQIQTELSSLTHSLITVKHDSEADARESYNAVYTLIQTEKVMEDREEYLETQLDRYKALYKTGRVKKDTLKETDDKLTEIQTEIAQNKTDLLAAEEKLGENIGLDITDKTLFEDPASKLVLSREYIEDWIEAAEDNDQALYEQRMDTEAKRLSVETTYSLMEDQYGSVVSPMKTYITQIENGDEINQAAMETKYAEIISGIESQADGTTRILGMNIDKSWLQGETSGIRYIEDDPQVLITAITDYQASIRKTDQAVEKLDQSVKDAYENAVKAKRILLTATNDHDTASENKVKKVQYYRQGLCTNEELLQAYEDEYDAHITLISAQKDYNDAIFELDRITCGGVDATIAEQEDSMKEVYEILYDSLDGSSYYIIPMAEKNAFAIGVDLEEDLQGYITDFELWVDNMQVGDRTSVDESLVHLNLTTQGSDNVVLRFYSGEEFISDCEIDPMVTNGKLEIRTNYHVADDTEEVIGTFTYKKSRSSSTINVKLDVDESANVQYFTVSDKSGVDLLSGKKLKVSESFTYLSIAAGSLSELTITFYGETGAEVCEARFDPSTRNIIKTADANEEE